MRTRFLPLAMAIATKFAFIAFAIMAFAIIASPPFPAQAQTPSQPLDRLTAQCNAGNISSCSAAGLALSDPQSARYDVFISLRYLQKACTAMDGAACGRLALIYFDGEGDVDQDWDAASNFSQKACAKRDRDGCDVAEAIFAEPASSFFDAEKALRYRTINCGFDRWQSCEQHARILYNLGDNRNAEQIAARACSRASAGNADSTSQSICDLAGSLEANRIKMEQVAAQQAARAQAARQATREADVRNKRAVVDSFLQDRNYDTAIYAAIYNSRTVNDASYALTATINAGALGAVYIDNLHVLNYWVPGGSLNQAVNAEIARRSRGKSNCGIFNCTNTPGASQARWRAQNGNRNTYRPRSSGPPANARTGAGLSTAQAQAQTRRKYRSAHCTMNNNANRNLC